MDRALGWSPSRRAGARYSRLTEPLGRSSDTAALATPALAGAHVRGDREQRSGKATEDGRAQVGEPGGAQPRSSLRQRLDGSDAEPDLGLGTVRRSRGLRAPALLRELRAQPLDHRQTPAAPL